MGEVEHDAERVLVFGLVIRLRAGRPAGEIGSAGVDYLLLRRVEVVHPHAEMIDADLLVAFLLEQRDVHDPIGHIRAARRRRSIEATFLRAVSANSVTLRPRPARLFGARASTESQ